MGCGASTQSAAPEAPEDPLLRLLRDIRQHQAALRGLLAELEASNCELRFLETTLTKLGHVNGVLAEAEEEAQQLYEDLKEHVAAQDAHDLREASVGFGTDESRMARVIVARLKENLDLTDGIYKQRYSRTLEDQIRGENKTPLGLITGSLSNFGKFLTYRCMEPAKRDAFLIHKCMSGFGCSDYILIEILSTRTNQELKDAAAHYAQGYGEDMAARIKRETGGLGKQWYGKWVDALVDFDRDESHGVVGSPAELAKALYGAGAGRWTGCDEQVFLDVLCRANGATCVAVAKAYEELDETSNSLREDVEEKMGGDLEFAVLARILPKAHFLAVRIYKACKGWGTDEECIGRILSCLDKQDCRDLEHAYNEVYADEEAPYNDLRSVLESELSGSFLQAMVALLETTPPKGHRVSEKTYHPAAERAGLAFGAAAASAYSTETAVQLGREAMHGPLLLCGVDGPFLRPDYDLQQLEAPRPPWLDEDRSQLFPSQEPTDVESAERLQASLMGTMRTVRGAKEGVQRLAAGARPGYQERCEELRRREHYLWRIVDDNAAMLEFCASRDADLVHEATEGWGTDENKLIRVLCALQKPQLRRVDIIHTERYGKTLLEVTNSELGGAFEGDFKHFLKCVLTPEAELDAELLEESMRGWFTDNRLLSEIVCTRSNRELREACEAFVRRVGQSVFDWVLPEGGLHATPTVMFGPSDISGYVLCFEGNGRLVVGPAAAAASQGHFKLVPGLADVSAVSIEAACLPGHFLRHRSGDLWLDSRPAGESEAFARDATWWRREALNGTGGLSLECYSQPQEYLCHRDGLLSRVRVESESDRGGASWAVLELVAGDHQAFLLACLRARRQEGAAAELALASQQAARLQEAGLGGGEVHAGTFCEVLAAASEAQMEAIMAAYEGAFGKPMADAIQEAMGGGWEQALLARTYDKPTYYAVALEKAMKGLGTDDKAVARILGRSSKASVKRIAARFEQLHGRSLHDAIRAETSGNFRKALLTMLFAEAPGQLADPGAEQAGCDTEEGPEKLEA